MKEPYLCRTAYMIGRTRVVIKQLQFPGRSGICFILAISPKQSSGYETFLVTGERNYLGWTINDGPLITDMNSAFNF